MSRRRLRLKHEKRILRCPGLRPSTTDGMERSRSAREKRMSSCCFCCRCCWCFVLFCWGVVLLGGDAGRCACVEWRTRGSIRAERFGAAAGPRRPRSLSLPPPARAPPYRDRRDNTRDLSSPCAQSPGTRWRWPTGPGTSPARTTTATACGRPRASSRRPSRSTRRPRRLFLFVFLERGIGGDGREICVTRRAVFVVQKKSGPPLFSKDTQQTNKQRGHVS